MTNQTANVLTNFGDPAITLSLVVFLFGWLVFAVSGRLALRWAIASLACGTAMTGMFVAFQLGRELFGPLGLRVPSGHVAGSSLAFGALALVAAGHDASWRRRVMFAAAAGMVVAMIAVTRVCIGAHTVPEIAVGAAAAVAPLAWFAAGYVRAGKPSPVWGAATGAAGALALALHGIRFDVWGLIRVALLHLKTVLST